MKLYEINKEIEKIMDNIENDDGTLSIENSSLLDQLQIEKESKLLDVACWIKKLKYESESLKSEAQNLTDRRKSIDRKIESLENYISINLEDKKIKISDSRTKISFRRSEFVDQLSENINFNDFPEDCFKIETAYKINKPAISEKIKSGLEVPCFQISERYNLQIK